LASTSPRIPFKSTRWRAKIVPPRKRKLSRSGIVRFLAEVEPCAIGMEACGSAHYWARRFRAMGHEVKLTPPIHVKADVKRGKNDAADAAAI
jgi:transposase